MTSTKPYRLLRVFQFILGLLGWLCIAGSVLVFCAITVPSLSNGSSETAAYSVALGFGLAVSTFTVGVGYLIAGQLIEVFVDIATNTQRTAYLLDHMIRHWPATNPAPLTVPISAPTLPADQ